MDRTEDTISQHFCWTYLRKEILTNIKVFKTCQENKKQNKYGHSAAKEEEAIPWGRLLVTLIVSYKIRR